MDAVCATERRGDGPRDGETRRKTMEKRNQMLSHGNGWVHLWYRGEFIEKDKDGYWDIYQITTA
jgi:hypothetical protein